MIFYEFRCHLNQQESQQPNIEDNIKVVLLMIEIDKRMTYQQILTSSGMGMSQVYIILVAIRKLCIRRISHKLTVAQKLCRINPCSETMRNFPVVTQMLYMTCLQPQQKYIICENFNYLTITVQEIQPGDRWTDGRIAESYNYVHVTARPVPTVIRRGGARAGAGPSASNSPTPLAAPAPPAARRAPRADASVPRDTRLPP
ncbi:hypothetical protein EVAR_11937_1 [Eumeta japonica]|uniref:Uncharacterized protein n=1 Tax=Eumeta variegata TaxID=151549 RepID=A0A4C1U4W3_EUMVA|nr:hypothetical protein EVAR_11937_1 [Eumeta japonica]